MKTLAHRAFPSIEVRDAPADSGFIGVLVGRAAVFGSDSEKFDGRRKPWVERIAQGAFKRTLDENPDVKALWSHRSDAILARTPNTLRLTEGPEGLDVEISLIDTSLNRDVLANIRSGNVDAMSFGFSARKTQWEEGEEFDVRTLLDVDLYEVSPVVWPAYAKTRVSARAACYAESRAAYEAELDEIDRERERYFRALRQALSDQYEAERRTWERRLRLRIQ
jgi:hypothetical protein